jgi:hypothetical protein
MLSFKPYTSFKGECIVKQTHIYLSLENSFLKGQFHESRTGFIKRDCDGEQHSFPRTLVYVEENAEFLR